MTAATARPEASIVVRHILLFTLREDADPEAARALLAEFSSFPDHFPQMRDWQFGRNASRRDQQYEFAMTVRFADWASLDAYLDSAFHERFVADRFRPLIARRAIASFEAPATI